MKNRTSDRSVCSCLYSQLFCLIALGNTALIPFNRICSSLVARFSGIRLLVAVAVMALSTQTSALELRDVEPSGRPPMLFTPIPYDGLAVIVPIVSPDIPSESQDNGSLLGTDADGDGVRDDLERYIATEYPDTPTIREALYRFVNAQQNLLIAYPSLSSASNAVRSAQTCIEQAMSGSATDAASNETLARLLNSKRRSLAYVRNSQRAISLLYQAPDLQTRCRMVRSST